MVVKIQVEVLGVVMLFSIVVGYQHFGEPCCLLQRPWLEVCMTHLNICIPIENIFLNMNGYSWAWMT